MTAIQKNNETIRSRMERAGIKIEQMDIALATDDLPFARIVYVSPRDEVQAAGIALQYERETGIEVFVKTV